MSKTNPNRECVAESDVVFREHPEEDDEEEEPEEEEEDEEERKDEDEEDEEDEGGYSVSELLQLPEECTVRGIWRLPQTTTTRYADFFTCEQNSITFPRSCGGTQATFF